MRTSNLERLELPAAIVGTLLIAVDHIGWWVGVKEDWGPTRGSVHRMDSRELQCFSGGSTGRCRIH